MEILKQPPTRCRPVPRSPGRLLAVAIIISFAGLIPRSPAAPSELELKAVYLFQFSQFVEWPKSAFASPDAPFVIGVVGSDPFGGALEQLVRGEKAAGRPIVVRHLAAPTAISGCQIVYWGPDALGPAADKDRPVLTVGEADDFLRTGGMIRFVRSRNRVRLHINVAAAQTVGLGLSSKLLGIAEKVEEAR